MPENELADALKGFLRIGLFVGVGGLVLLLLVPPGSAEQVLSVCSATLGFVIVAGVFAVKRVME